MKPNQTIAPPASATPRDADYRVAAEAPHFGAGENTDEDFELNARVRAFEADWAVTDDRLA